MGAGVRWLAYTHIGYGYGFRGGCWRSIEFEVSRSIEHASGTDSLVPANIELSMLS
jgi:hypothetical protein